MKISYNYENVNPQNIINSILRPAIPNAILKLPEIYMEKLFVGPTLANTININDDFITNIKAIQRKKKT